VAGYVVIDSGRLAPWYVNMTTAAKPEVLNRRAQTRPQSMQQNLERSSVVWFSSYVHGQTDILTTICCNPQLSHPMQHGTAVTISPVNRQLRCRLLEGSSWLTCIVAIYWYTPCPQRRCLLRRCSAIQRDLRQCQNHTLQHKSTGARCFFSRPLLQSSSMLSTPKH